MCISDPISDMLTRIRNGQLVGKSSVEMPSSSMKVMIVEVLCSEGYVRDFEVIKKGNKFFLIVNLKYHNGERVINTIRRESRPGLRVYKSHSAIPEVMSGLGISIVSTSKGVMTGKDARNLGVGGELLCVVT